MIAALPALRYSDDPPMTRASSAMCWITRPHTTCSYASAMSTETSIFDFFASVKITPLTGGTSP
jgi:hypothetical protein